MEDWAEIRRLRRAEGVPIKEIARRMGIARNTVRAALTADRPPQYQRPRRGSVADAYEPQIRALLREWPKIPGPVVALTSADRSKSIGVYFAPGTASPTRAKPPHCPRKAFSKCT